MDESLIRKIDQEISAVEQLEQQNPNDPKWRERKAALTDLKSETEERIEDRKGMIANLDNNPAETVTPETNWRLWPRIRRTIEAINESTPKATLEKQNALDETLVGKIDQEIRKVEQQQQQNPTDPKLNERKRH